MSDETVVTEPEDEDEVLEDEDEEVLDVVNTPLVVPELDLEGGTVFKVGDQEYGSMREAQEAAASSVGEEYEEPVTEDDVAVVEE